MAEAKRFEKATLIRRYIQEVEKNAISENTLTDELKDWIKWAKNRADWLDPIINKKRNNLS